MDKLIDYLKLNNKELFENIKIVSISFDKIYNKLVVKIVYKIDFNFEDRYKHKIVDDINNFLCIPNLEIELKTKKSYVEKSIIIDQIKYFFNLKYSSILSTMQNDDISLNLADNQEYAYIDIKFNSGFLNFLNQNNVAVMLKQYFEDMYFQNFNINFSIKTDYEDIQNVFSEDMFFGSSESESITSIELDNIKTIFGKEPENIAIASKSLASNMTNVTIAGEIMYINKKSYISKRKNDNGEEKFFYSFVISDQYGKTHCVYFPQKDNIEKFEAITEKSVVAVTGDTEEYNDKLNFKVKGIASCEVIVKEEVIPIKTENEKYLYTFPETYVTLSQTSLFDSISVNNNQFLKDNDCVVFDVETTGLDPMSCEVIEIGACKVRDGKIIETFSCLIKPTTPIPSNITELTGITNEMVKDCRPMTDLLQDFYKFTRNSVLVAYNIDFDYKFISIAGKKQGYIFDNPQIDALILAREKLKGLKNYKLKTVATALDVSLENAHRAVHDAIATAESFIKLVDSDYKI